MNLYGLKPVHHIHQTFACQPHGGYFHLRVKNRRITKDILKYCLVIWGIVCLLGLIAIVGLVSYRFGWGNHASTETASAHDVRFILNWCKLGSGRIEKVVHSYKSARSFTGDHLDAHAIKITTVDPKELVPNNYGSGWYRCDEAKGALKDAINFICNWKEDDISWFPTANELHSSEIYVYPQSIYYNGTQPTAADLIFVRPKDKMLFFISSKM